MIDADVPWVLKVGGRELEPGPELERLVGIVRAAVRAGASIVLVHGGGSEISRRAEELGLPIERRDGLRVTSDAMLDVVVEVLAGRVNTRLVGALVEGGVPAIGVSGVSGRLLSVVPSGDPPGSLGWVGEPAAVDARWLRGTLADGFAPVVAPLGVDPSGHVRNVNADLAAGAIASALSADLLLLTDVPAVLDAAGRPIPLLRAPDALRLRRTSVTHGGMLPKLDAAFRSLAAGARSAWIGGLDGLGPRGPGVGVGTRVVGPRDPRASRASVRSSPLAGAA